MNNTALDESSRLQCPTCGNNTPSLVHPEARDYITHKFFQVLECPECKLAWTSPVPADLEPHYPRWYRRYNPLVIGTLTFFYKMRVRRWCRRIEKPGSALEIGCGDGFMLNALRSHGWKVAGTERTEQMASFARDRLGIPVYVEPSNPIPPNEKFDLVVMCQVLEHLHDPVAQLCHAASLLSPDGIIVVGVPNFASWQSSYGKASWLHLDVPRHLIHFSPHSIDETAQRAGLEVRSIDFSSMEHDPYGWVQTILNRVFRNGNRLTAQLMRSAPWRYRDAITIFTALLLTLPSILLARISWLFQKGAIMEVVLAKRTQSN